MQSKTASVSASLVRDLAGGGAEGSREAYPSLPPSLHWALHTGGGPSPAQVGLGTDYTGVGDKGFGDRDSRAFCPQSPVLLSAPLPGPSLPEEADPSCKDYQSRPAAKKSQNA